MPLWPSSSKHRTCAPDMLFTQTIKSQNVAKPHSSGEETLRHNRRTCPGSGLHCGIGSHCLTDSCRKNEEEEEDINTVPARSSHINTVPARSSHINTVPARSSHTNTVPARSSHINPIPARPSHIKTIPERSSHTSTVPERSSHTNTIPERSSYINTIPARSSQVNPSLANWHSIEYATYHTS